MAGEPFDVAVTLWTDRDLSIRELTARLVVTQGFRIGSAREELEAPKLLERLWSGGRLRVGERLKFETTFLLPADTPPTHALTPAFVAATLYVNVRTPWWRYDEGRKVGVTVTKRVEGDATRGDLARISEDGIELVLPASRYAVTEVIEGTVSLADASRDHQVELALVPVLDVRHHPTAYTADSGYKKLVTIPVGSAGLPVPFQLPIGHTLPASFDGGAVHDVRWTIRARVLGLNTYVTLPITLHARSALALLPALVPLADMRSAAARILAALAAHRGARISDPNHQTLTLTLGHVRLVLTYANTTLTSRLEHAPLGLDLLVVPSTLVDRVLRADIELGLPDWDRALSIASSHPVFAANFLRSVLPALPTSLGTLVGWTDDYAAFALARPALAPETFAAALDALEALVPTVLAARDAIPSPPRPETSARGPFR